MWFFGTRRSHCQYASSLQIASSTSVRCSVYAPNPASVAALEALDAAYTHIFNALHLEHFTPEQLVEAAADGELVPSLVASAAVVRLAMFAKVRMSPGSTCHSVPSYHRSLRQLEVANACNVRRLDELALLPPGTLPSDTNPHILSAAWAPHRRGVQISGLLDDEFAPQLGSPTTATSEWWLFAGSLWRLDLKRFRAEDEAGEDGDGEEMFAVYLRRRSLRDSGVVGISAGAGTGAFEDTRERTSLAFGIRLCGAPGSPTMLIVSGRRWGWVGMALFW